MAFSSSHFGNGIGTIYLDSVACSGNENQLIDCTRSSNPICNNGHQEDAGVRCQVGGESCFVTLCL